MKKILIVDDEPHGLFVLTQFLERAGFEVFTALNGQLALDLIAKEEPDVLVTDVQMPTMNGISLCEALKAKATGLPGLIMLMTSRTDRDIRTWVDSQDNIVMLEKPLSMRHLVNRISDYFASSGIEA